MKVKELIKELKRCNGEEEVVMSNWVLCSQYEILGVNRNGIKEHEGTNVVIIEEKI